MPAPRNNKHAVGNKGGGRKSTYKPEYAEQARKLCNMGFTDEQLGEFFGVTERTINRWKLEHVEFMSALSVGKAHADDIVERSTFIAINGFTRTVRETVEIDGEKRLKEKEIYYPPNPAVGIKWLAARRPETYGQKPEGEGATVLAEGLKAALLEMTQKSREKRAERRRLAKETSH